MKTLLTKKCMTTSSKILLIGNDTIVRFNWGVKDKGRTDVWVDALLHHEKKIRHHYMKAGHPEIWRLNGESRARMSHMPSEWYPKTTFIDVKDYKKMRSQFKSSWKPSIGYVCIWWLLNVQNERDITITGFDSGHDWKKERLFLEALISDGSLKRL